MKVRLETFGILEESYSQWKDREKTKVGKGRDEAVS